MIPALVVVAVAVMTAVFLLFRHKRGEPQYTPMQKIVRLLYRWAGRHQVFARKVDVAYLGWRTVAEEPEPAVRPANEEQFPPKGSGEGAR